MDFKQAKTKTQHAKGREEKPCIFYRELPMQSNAQQKLEASQKVENIFNEEGRTHT